MAVTYVAGARTAIGTTAAPALTIPSGVQANDIVLATIFVQASSTVTMTTPASGFTVLGDSPIRGTDTPSASTFHYWKRATAADTGTYTFTLSAALNLAGFVTVYRGAITSGNPWDSDTASGHNFGIDTTPALSITTTVADTLLVWVATSNYGYQIATMPSGFTANAQGVNDDTDFGFCLGSKTLSGTSSGSVSGTWNTLHAETGQAWLGALKPVATTVSNKMWSGSAWVTTGANKRWNGSAWVNTPIPGVL